MSDDPWLLAVETATQTASWALWRGRAPVAERAAEPGLATAEALLPALDALLAEAELRLDAIDAYAVSIGPGSFTGLRIGVATLKGLAFGSPAPVLAVPTLAALAHAAPGAAPVAALLDARRGELYAAGFEAGAAAAWLPEGVHPIEEVARRLPVGCRVLGEGLAVCRQQLEAARGAELAFPDPGDAPLAHHVAALGVAALARGEGVAAAELVPRYLRRADAEVKRTGERFEAPAGSARRPSGSRPL